jgi:hypothetical protein
MDVCSLVGGSVTKQKNGRADGMMGCLSCGIPTRPGQPPTFLTGNHTQRLVMVKSRDSRDGIGMGLRCRTCHPWCAVGVSPLGPPCCIIFLFLTKNRAKKSYGDLTPKHASDL